MKAPIKLNLDAQTIESAAPSAKTILEQAKKSLGFVPNMYALMANSPGLLDTYIHGYQRFRSDSGFTPVEQEVIFLTISFENGCDYCMAAHSMIAAPTLPVLLKGSATSATFACIRKKNNASSVACVRRLLVRAKGHRFIGSNTRLSVSR